MAEIRCPKCNLYQDAERPVCSHMLGRKGGLIVLAKYGRDHYRKAGAKGMAAAMAQPGAKERLAAAGRKGGATMKAKFDRAHYQELGRRAGAIQHRRAEREKAEELVGDDFGRPVPPPTGKE